MTHWALDSISNLQPSHQLKGTSTSICSFTMSTLWLSQHFLPQCEGPMTTLSTVHVYYMLSPSPPTFGLQKILLDFLLQCAGPMTTHFTVPVNYMLSPTPTLLGLKQPIWLCTSCALTEVLHYSTLGLAIWHCWHFVFFEHLLHPYANEVPHFYALVLPSWHCCYSMQ